MSSAGAVRSYAQRDSVMLCSEKAFLCKGLTYRLKFKRIVALGTLSHVLLPERKGAIQRVSTRFQNLKLCLNLLQCLFSSRTLCTPLRFPEHSRDQNNLQTGPAVVEGAVIERAWLLALNPGSATH